MNQEALFTQFIDSKKRLDLVAEAKQGNDYAKTFLEAFEPTPETFEVLGYATEANGTPRLFIEIMNGGYVLEIANTCETAKTEQALKLLEKSLFKWAYDEGYFDS